jgi:hypothetical protein
VRRIQVPDARLFFPGALLSQLDFILIGRTPIVGTRQLGDLAIRTIPSAVNLFAFLIARIHSAIGNQIQRSEKSIFLISKNSYRY